MVHQQPVQTRNPDIEEPVDRHAGRLSDHCRSSATPMSAVPAVMTSTDGAALRGVGFSPRMMQRRPRCTRPAADAPRRLVDLPRGPRGQHAGRHAAEPVRDLHHLRRRLALAVDHLRETGADGPVVVHLGKAEILERQYAQAVHGLVRLEFAGGDLGQQVFQVVFVHVYLVTYWSGVSAPACLAVIRLPRSAPSPATSASRANPSRPA